MVPDLALVGWLPFALPRALALARRERLRLRDHHVAAAVRAPDRRRAAPRRRAVDRRPARRLDVRPAARRLADARCRRPPTARSSAPRSAAPTASSPSPRRSPTTSRGGSVATVAVITNGFDPEEASRRRGARRPADARPALARPHRPRRRVRPLAADVPRGRRGAARAAGRRWPSGSRSCSPARRPPRSASCSPTSASAASRARSACSSARARSRSSAAADSLLVLAQGASARSVATNKLYEYLAARRPVLVLGDDSEAARIVAATESGIVRRATTPGAIADAVRRLVAGEVQAGGVGLDRYAWPALAGALRGRDRRRRAGLVRQAASAAASRSACARAASPARRRA